MTLIHSQFELPRAALRRGLTIVELLVAVSILSLLAVILVPQVRMLNRERGIREAARVLGSIFVEASNRARVDGYAAVGIRRNPNYIRKVNSSTGVHDIFYAGSALYLLKRLPPYTGNEEGSSAEIPSGASPPPPAGAIFVDIPIPLDNSLASQIRSGCKLLLGSVRTPLEVLGAQTNSGKLRLTCALPLHLSPFPEGKPLSFRLDRPPAKVSNSEVSIPRGHYINLNYSGPTSSQTTGVSEWSARDLSPFTWTYFSEDRGDNALNLSDVIVVFGPNGGIDRIYSNGEADGWRFPSSALNLCVCSDEFGNSFDAAADSLPRSVAVNGKDVLNQEDLLWVSISNVAGTVSVSPIAPLSSTVTNPDVNQPARILESQAFRAVSQAAGQ
jgi:prepilin-type N-terminal cleavage/methylation domain-containing protein